MGSVPSVTSKQVLDPAAGTLTEAQSRGDNLLLVRVVDGLEALGGFAERRDYDILIESGQKVGEISEDPNPGWVGFLSRFASEGRRPFRFRAKSGGATVLTVERAQPGWTPAPTYLRDGRDGHVGVIDMSWFSLARRFHVYGPDNARIGEISGRLFGNRFSVCDGSGREIATIEKLLEGQFDLLGANRAMLLKLSPVATGAFPLIVVGAALLIDVSYYERNFMATQAIGTNSIDGAGPSPGGDVGGAP